MKNNHFDEYFLLTDKLDEVTWALEGECNDIDCDKYMYKDLLKKKYKPVLKHSFSCINSLKREKEALIRLLSMAKFRKFRYKRCKICKKDVDTLSDTCTIVSFTRPKEWKDQKVYEWNGIHVHKGCKKKVKTPAGWTKL